MTTNMHRRKATNPARLNDCISALVKQKELTTGDCDQAETNSKAPLSNGHHDMKIEPPDAALKSGTIVGPFAAKLVDGSKIGMGERYVKLIDSHGVSHCFLVASPEIANALRSFHDPTRHEGLAENAETHFIDGELIVKLTASVMRQQQIISVLRSTSEKPTKTASIASPRSDVTSVDSSNQSHAARTHPCQYCGAKFSTTETLQAHHKYYCGPASVDGTPAKRPRIATAASATRPIRPNQRSPPATLPQPNTVLLPVALLPEGSSSQITILGPPQTVIPVAISPSLQLTSPHLQITTSLLPTGVNVVESLKISGADLPDTEMRISAEPASSLDLRSFIANQARPASEPLDLTTSTGSNKSVSPPMVKSPKPLRTFKCKACSVTFSASKTLHAHERFYCRAINATQASPEPDPLQNAFGCQHCPHVAVSSERLSQHMRNQHADRMTITCKLCGYKGYSARGIKTHLRAAHENELADVINLDDVIEDYVNRAEREDEQDDIVVDVVPSPIFVCQDCHASFSNFDEYIDHGCTASLASESLEGDLVMADGDIKPSTMMDPGFTPTVNPDGSGAKYSCNFCTYASAHKGNVKRHLALIHKHNPSALASVSKSSSHKGDVSMVVKGM